jgi:hypothetical protein
MERIIGIHKTQYAFPSVICKAFYPHFMCTALPICLEWFLHFTKHFNKLLNFSIFFNGKPISFIVNIQYPVNRDVVLERNSEIAMDR